MQTSERWEKDEEKNWFKGFGKWRFSKWDFKKVRKMKIKIEERSQLYVYTDYEERNIYPLELNLMGVPELNI